MKKIKKIYIALAASALIVCIAAFTTAYLTETDLATNRFTLGDVDIRLKEPNYPHDPDERILSFGQRMQKDPFIVNKGKNDVIVFLKLTVPLETVTLLDENGQKITEPYSTPCEILNFVSADDNEFTTDTQLSIGNNWVLLSEETRTIGTDSGIKVYVFGYCIRLKQGESTTNLFDTIYLKSFIEQSNITLSARDINVIACGIQADNIGVAEETDGKYSQESLNAAYAKIFDTTEG